jgi:citrate synthase
MGAVERKPFRWHSTISYKLVDKIVTRGYDTTELVEKGYGIADLIFINYQARIPLIEETKMLHYLMILCLDEGLSTPVAISRLVANGDNLLTQAVGASVLAFGHAYGAFQTHGRMLESYMDRAKREHRDLDAIAEMLVKENQDSLTLGVSHLMVRDPAAKRVFARAERLGVAGRHIDLQKRIVQEVQRTSSEPVDLDMLGAIGATMLDLGFTPEATWTIVAIARAFGSGAHAIEEEEREQRCIFGQSLTPRELYDGPGERAVPPVADRDRIAKPGQSRTVDEWKRDLEERKKLTGSGHSIVEAVEDPRKMVKTRI